MKQTDNKKKNSPTKKFAHCQWRYGRGSSCPSPEFLGCLKYVWKSFLPENFRPKMQNLGLKQGRLQGGEWMQHAFNLAQEGKIPLGWLAESMVHYKFYDIFCLQTHFLHFGCFQKALAVGRCMESSLRSQDSLVVEEGACCLLRKNPPPLLASHFRPSGLRFQPLGPCGFGVGMLPGRWGSTPWTEDPGLKTENPLFWGKFRGGEN